MTSRKVRFPARRKNGTFAVDVVVRVPNADSVRMGEWLEWWVTSNATWYWGSEPDSSIEGSGRLLELSSTFDPPPRVQAADGDTDVVRIRLFGTREAPFWRDWVAKLLHDAGGEFGAVDVLRVVNAEAD